jgi:transposase-like protein
LAEALVIIQTQQETIAQQQKRIVELERRVEELEARLKRDSSNSSQPPSSDPPWKAPSDRNQGRNRGGQPGHRGHKRELVEPDRIEEYRPVACVHCGEALVGDDPEPYRHQVTEIPEVAAVVTEHRVHTLRCEACRKETRGVLPDDVPRSAFGPRLQAVVAVCSGAYRLSKRSIEELVRDFFGVKIALGSVSNIEQYVSEAIAAPVEEARSLVQKARVVHLDETSWFQHSSRAWLWTAVTARVAVFLIRPTRSRQVALELVRRWFPGVVVSDRYNAYHWVEKERHQYCWAHLIRDFRELADLHSDSKEFGQRMMLAISRMFDRWHETRDGTVAEVTAALASSRDEIHRLLDEGGRSDVVRVRRLCKPLLRQEISLWTFVGRHDVEPTNNAAERALRAAVLWRKSSLGTDSEKGSRFVERILTVVTSLRMQGRHVLGYIADACHRTLVPRPALPIWVHP